MANLSNLSPSEYEQIASVLKRDRELRSMEETRIRQLKQELLFLRQRAVLKPGFDPERCCARCLVELGRILNRGSLCPLCLKKVCKDCRNYGDENHEWLCIYCYKQMQLKAVSGEWMLEFSRLSVRNENSSTDQWVQRAHSQGATENDDKGSNSSLISVESPPEKPPRIFSYEPPFQKLSPRLSETLNQSANCNEDEPTKSSAKDTPLQRQESYSHRLSPKMLSRISPWTDIDPEPTIPVRINKSRPFSALQQNEVVESINFKERQSSDEGRCTLGYRSRSSSDVMEESESHVPVPSPRKRLNPLKKQQAIPDQICVDNQQSSVETTDSGVCSPGTLDISSPLVSTVPSNDHESSTQCLVSESSLSETDEDRVSHAKISGDYGKKRKSIAEEKHSVHSADESGNSLRSSPHNRLRMRNRSLSGGSEDGRQRKTSLPQISVSGCLEGQSSRLSTTSSDKDSSGMQDDEIDQPLAYPCRSQMSLSSFGGRSESVTSVYSAAGGGRYGTVIVTGDVLFGFSYSYKIGTMEINIKECRNLAPVDTKRNRSDPYVKVYLLPDRTKSGKRKTKVKKHTLNPVFDEVLKFHVTISELEIRTLWLSVWHSDRFGRNDFLGEVMLPLGTDAFESSGLKWYPLQERLETLDAPVSYKGDLILALKYVPPDVTSRKFSKKPGSPVKGSLEILVREARNLMATRSNGTSDPFCKSYLLPDKSKGGKQKTSVLKKSCNPKWNHTFVYDDVSLDDLRERCLELTIWDYDKITSNDFLGGVRLCLGTGKYQGRDVDWMDSVGEERSLWYTMLERPNKWVDGSLLLRPSMQSRRAM